MNPRKLARDHAHANERLQGIVGRLRTAGARQIERLGQKLEAIDRLRETLSYKATLARGYAVVRGGGEIVTTRSAAEQASGLEIEFSDGRLRLGGASSGRKSSSKAPEQGSLF